MVDNAISTLGEAGSLGADTIMSGVDAIPGVDARDRERDQRWRERGQVARRIGEFAGDVGGAIEYAAMNPVSEWGDDVANATQAFGSGVAESTRGRTPLQVADDLLWGGLAAGRQDTQRRVGENRSLEQYARRNGDEEAADAFSREASDQGALNSLYVAGGALEATPAGLIAPLAGSATRFTARNIMRALGREIPLALRPRAEDLARAIERASLEGNTERVADLAGQLERQFPGQASSYWARQAQGFMRDAPNAAMRSTPEDVAATRAAMDAASRNSADAAAVLRPMTAAGTRVRNAVIGAIGAPAGALIADAALDGGDMGDPAQLTGGALIGGRRLVGPAILRGAESASSAIGDVIRTLRARRVGEGAPRSFEGAPRVYRDGYAETTIEPDGRIVHTYQGGFTAGATDARAAGTGGEAVQSMRAARRALDQDISETQRPAYHWYPGDEGAAPDQALQSFYRRQLSENPPQGYAFSETPDGMMHLNRVVEAEASPSVQRNFEAAVRDPETGRVYTGQDHAEAIDSAPDGVRERLQAIYDAPTEDPNAIGFQVNGQFMSREDGLQSLRAGRRQVRVGEALDTRRNGTGAITRDPLNPENGRLPADDQWFNDLAGVPTPPRRVGASAQDLPEAVPPGLMRIGNDGVEIANWQEGPLLREDGMGNQPTRISNERPDAGGVQVRLYRGVGAGRDAASTADTSGNALFMSPERSVAENYAGKGGNVIEETVTFNNLLTAPNWMVAKDTLGLPRSATMDDLIRAARNAGHDGLSFTTTNGPEYIRIQALPDGGSVRAPPNAGPRRLGGDRPQGSITSDPNGDPLQGLDTTPSVSDPVAMRHARGRRLGFDMDNTVYRGVFHDPNVEDAIQHGNPESHHGRAEYFSSSTNDVERNYSTPRGADLTNRIEQRAERLADEIESDPQAFGIGPNDSADFMEVARRLAREEGMLVGPSSGANVHAAIEVASRVTGPVVTILCDSGERYLLG